MIEVTTKRAHRNAYGDNHEKADGDAYSIPTRGEAQALANEGLVTFDGQDAVPSETPAGSGGHRKKAAPSIDKTS